MGSIFRNKASAPDESDTAELASHKDSSAETVRAALIDFVSDKVGGNASIDPRVDIFDAGYVDSISAVELLGKIESSFGVRLNEVDLVSSLNTLEALALHLSSVEKEA